MTDIFNAIAGVFILAIGLGCAVIIALFSAFMDVLEGIKKWAK